jgi:lysyl-tRNA synthetase class 2
MLEWYRAYSNLDAIADDVDQLLQSIAQQFELQVLPLKRTTIAQLFADAFPGFTLTPSTTRDELAKLASTHKIAVGPDDSFDDVFFRLFLEKIESKLGHEGPLLVSHYPPSQAALSRIGAHGFAERFEVYWNGLELANAFHELNDPLENEKRFAQDAAAKASLGKPPVPRDENLVRALKKGMPPSGGIALGVDRLFMALFGISEIAETRAFPLTRRD